MRRRPSRRKTVKAAAPRRNIRPRNAGFTLIELLVVLVILPVIIGAISEALIVSFENDAATNSRLSDSVNSQLTSTYFVRDVQGAAFVTKYNNSRAGIYFSNSPQICAPPIQGTFLIALFHPAVAGGSALDVSYWQDGTGSGTTIDRYSCTLSTPGDTSISPTKVVLASAPSGTATGAATETISAVAEIRPVQFDNAAAASWTLASALTTVASPIASLPATSVSVASTYGFTMGTLAGAECSPTGLWTSSTSMSGCSGGTITLAGIDGTTQVVCTGITPTTFANCRGGSGAVGDGSAVTQSNISAVQITVAEPATSFRYTLLGAPLAGTGAAPGAIAPGGRPTLLALGSAGITVRGGASATCRPGGPRVNICVQAGGVVLDGGGPVVCPAGPRTYLDSPGGVASVSPPGLTSCNGVSVATTPGIPDSIGSYLPACFPSSVTMPLDPTPIGGVSTPGRYTTTKPSGRLEPGLYVVEKGIGAITGMVTPSRSDPNYQVSGSYDPTAGVLFYVPGPDPMGLDPMGCLSAAGSAGSGLSGSLAGLVPLDAAQSSSFFQGSSALDDVWLWQDKTNTATMSATGTTNGGVAYLPSATFSLSGNSSLTTGSMIAGSIQMNGTPSLILTGT